MTREEAIEVYRGLINTKIKEAFEFFAPELVESEDERIRKEILAFVIDMDCKESWIHYLEKQKEHQFYSDAPNESSWSGIISSSHKDKNLDEIAQDYVDGVKEYNPEPTWDLMQTAVCYGYHYREGEEQKPADRFEEAREKYQVEWSEEDEKILDSLIRLYSKEYSAKAWPWANGAFTYGDVVNFLKSRHPHWKPSEEQIHAIIEALKYLPNNKDEWRVLNTLVDVFRKLM